MSFLTPVTIWKNAHLKFLWTACVLQLYLSEMYIGRKSQRVYSIAFLFYKKVR